MANNLTLTGAAFDTTGEEFGSAALSGGYGVAPGGLITGFPFTIEIRFKRTAAPSALEVVMGQSGTGWIGMTPAGDVEMELGNGSGATPNATSSGSFADGEWHHAALSVTSTTYMAFVDGNLIGSGTTPPMAAFAAAGEPPSATGTLAVRNHGGSLQYEFGGEVDEAAVWNTARYTEAFTPPPAAYTGAETGLLALWHLDGDGSDSAGGFHQIQSYTPTAAAAVGQVGGGWTDVGPSWSIYNDGTHSSLANEWIAGSPWNDGQLVRKASSEACVNQRIQSRFNISEQCDFWHMHRYSAPDNDGSATAILAKAGQIFNLVNGGLTTQQGNGISLTPGGWYDLQTDCVQQGDSTLLTITAFNVADPYEDAFGSGSQISSNEFTITDAAVQNLSGGMGMFFYDGTQSSGGKLVHTVTTYSGDGAAEAATTYELTGPTNGEVGAASSAFTVEASGTLPTAVTITPSDDGEGGTFSPASITLAAGSTNAVASFTYTADSAGAKTITTTNTGELADPAALTYTAYALTTLGVTSTAARFSPANWSGDAGRGGANWRRSWNNGAWVEFVWTASASPTATLLLNSPNSACRLSYFLNGVLTDNVGATGNIAIGNLLPSAVNVLRVYLRSSPQSSRWGGGANTVQIQGLQIDSGSAGGAGPTGRPWISMDGDSITEGIAANGGADDHLLDYSFLVARALEALGYDVGVRACGYSGWIHTGDGNPGDVPAYYAVSGSSNGAGGQYNDSASRWNKVDSGVSLLDSNGIMSAQGAAGTPPAAVYINYMTNEALSGLSVSDAQASVTQALAALRAAAPGAWLFVQVPFGLYFTGVFSNPAYLNALKAGVAAYRAANPSDARVKLIDFGPTFSQTIEHAPYINSDNVHPIAAGHALIAPMVAQAILSSLLGQVRSPTYR